MEDEKPNHESIRSIHIYSYICITIVLFFTIFYFLFVQAPINFPQNSIITISSGENLKAIVNKFKQNDIICSPLVFQSLVIIFGGEKKVIAGDYLLQDRENAVSLAWRIISGSFGMTEIKVTIPEGFSVSDIGDLLEKKLVTFDKYRFLSEAKDKEGYLFPDTYFFPPTATSSQIILRMEENFREKIKQFDSDIIKSGHNQYDILKMASILEGEATSTADREIVAGILWTRIRKDIALQVDATFKYINGKSSAELTLDDLKINSSYNTYLYRGLPPTPINNPGVDAIFATLHPIKTSYLYFLTGSDGATHYAKTFEEHRVNIQKYLR